MYGNTDNGVNNLLIYTQYLIILYISPNFRPGTYEHSISKNRKVDWHQSFGGTPISLPSITQHSTIDRNTEKVIYNTM